jgi:hypothetical protein
MTQFSTTTSPASQELVQRSTADATPAYPRGDDVVAALSKVDVIRESFSLLPIVAIDELI